MRLLILSLFVASVTSLAGCNKYEIYCSGLDSKKCLESGETVDKCVDGIEAQDKMIDEMDDPKVCDDFVDARTEYAKCRLDNCSESDATAMAKCAAKIQAYVMETAKCGMGKM